MATLSPREKVNYQPRRSWRLGTGLSGTWFRGLGFRVPGTWISSTLGACGALGIWSLGFAGDPS